MLDGPIGGWPPTRGSRHGDARVNDPDQPDSEGLDALSSAYESYFESTYAASTRKRARLRADLIGAPPPSPYQRVRIIGAFVAVAMLAAFVGWWARGQWGDEEPTAQPQPAVAEPTERNEPAVPAGWKDLSQAGKPREAFEATRPEFASLLKSSNADDVWDLAGLARFASDDERTVLGLQTFHERFPDDPRATLAAYRLATHYLAADETKTARRWLGSVLSNTPPGDVEHERALSQLIRLCRSETAPGCGQWARTYLEHYPDSPDADDARGLIDESAQKGVAPTRE